MKINGTSVKISQLTFLVAEKNAIDTTVSPYSGWGADPMSASGDHVFSDGTVGQVATLLNNTSTTGYWDRYLEVTMPGTAASRVQNIEHITGGQSELGQNYPNPFEGQTEVPFHLTSDSEVSFGIYVLQDKRTAEFKAVTLSAGEHKWIINLK